MPWTNCSWFQKCFPWSQSFAFASLEIFFVFTLMITWTFLWAVTWMVSVFYYKLSGSTEFVVLSGFLHLISLHGSNFPFGHSLSLWSRWTFRISRCKIPKVLNTRQKRFKSLGLGRDAATWNLATSLDGWLGGWSTFIIWPYGPARAIS